MPQICLKSILSKGNFNRWKPQSLPSGGVAAGQNGAGEPAEPAGPLSGAAHVAKAPLPEQYEPMKQSFDNLLSRCRSAPNVNSVLKKKLDDAQKRLNSLYDKLRKNGCSQLGEYFKILQAKRLIFFYKDKTMVFQKKGKIHVVP